MRQQKLFWIWLCQITRFVSTIVHLRWVGGQNCIKFGPISCWIYKLRTVKVTFKEASIRVGLISISGYGIFNKNGLNSILSNRPLCLSVMHTWHSDMQSVSMDQSAALRVKNRRILPDVVDYQLQLNAKNSQIMRVQQNQGNGKTYISVFNTAPANETTTDKKCKNHNNLDILTHHLWFSI